MLVLIHFSFWSKHKMINDILCCPATDLVKNVSYHKLMRRLALRMAVVDTTFKMNCKAVVAWSDQPE